MYPCGECVSATGVWSFSIDYFRTTWFTVLLTFCISILELLLIVLFINESGEVKSSIFVELSITSFSSDDF